MELINSNPKRVAVIDIGTANAKVIVADITRIQEVKIFYRNQQRVYLPHDKVGESLKGSLPIEAALLNIMQTIDSLTVHEYRVVGTEGLRKFEDSNSLVSSISQIVKKPVEILSQEQEADFFYNAVATYLTGRIAAVDIGGGSAQLCVGYDKQLENRFLLNTGTITLDRRFTQAIFPRDETIDAVWNYVKDQCASLNIPRLSDRTLVYGSTRILNFFRRVNVGTEETGNLTYPRTVTLSETMKLYRKILHLSEEERTALFPEESFFMRGADLSLINVICLCEALGIDKIAPTNLNLSDGILLSMV